MAGIYVHIPFCKKRCYYCDFYKCFDTSLTAHYIESLLKEAEIRKEYLEESQIDTIYFGGGTPSVLQVEQLDKIKGKIIKLYPCSQKLELTIELNPDDTSLDYYTKLKDSGFNRISLGVQSWDDDILKFLNRRHDSAQAAKSLEEARKCGFDNISVDLIYGIPHTKTRQWEEDLDITFKSGVEHLSAYHLTIEDGTMFHKMFLNGNLRECDEQESEKQFNILLEQSAKFGYQQYEISNFCRANYYSKHNTNYWKQVPYIGLGPSSHSFNGNSRQWNVSDINIYTENLNKNIIPCEEEKLDDKTKYNEYIMTSLRTMWGVDLDEVERKHNKETRDYLLNISNRFVTYGMMEIIDKRTLLLTNQGKLISDNIISELMMV